MRNRKTIKLARGLLLTVHEFSVAEVVSFLTALGDVDYNDESISGYVTENPVDFFQRAERLVSFKKGLIWRLMPDKALFKIYQAEILPRVIEVNHAYFQTDKKRPDTKRLRKTKASVIVQSLQNSLEVLIREGHTNPQQYGWAFFNNACQYQEKLSKEK